MARRLFLAAAFAAAAVFSSQPVLGGIIRTQRTTGAQFPTQAYGYIPISTQYDSAMFYGIRGDDSKSEAERAAMPLVMWLQGGPGATSQFGDLLESGPLKLSIANNSAGYSLGAREHTWTRRANMLYVDNPVGTGFSYTNNPAGFATTDDQIAADLVVFLRGFLQKHTEFQQKDFWVFCESYGGKMTAYFGAALLDAKLPVNFKGVALGDGWVDPLGCMDSYAPYLTAFSQISPAQAAEVTSVAKLATSAWKSGNGTLATNLWSAQQDMIQLFTNNLNWYNTMYYYDYTADNQLDVYLNSTAFNQVLMFHGVHLPEGFYYNKQSNDVFSYMSGHFMDNGTAQVLKMLEAGLDVNVYGGQLDLIVDTLCIQGWLYNLPWAGMDKFKSADSRSALMSDDAQTMYGFVQSYQNLHFWQINGAGHMVPLDQPAAAFRMFEDILSGSSVGARRSKAVSRMPVNRRKRHI